VRGLRINLYSPIKSPGGNALDVAFAATAAAARMMGWHVQVIAPLPVLLANMNVLAEAPVPLVIDHYGLYGHERPDGAAGRRLLDLMSLPQVWMKLSAPYRHDRGPLNTKPDREWLAALVAAAPDRCVWGSDWPHTPPHEEQMGSAVLGAYRNLRYETLIDDFMEAVGAAELAERILSDNPARLYGFE
jgi:predicted TIM-barrel fold metal-dependent hydrolase